MTKKRKNYNDKAPYLVKKARNSNDRPMCSICKKCLNKDFCNHRRDLKLMNKCTDCHNCSDNEHCDKFYISEQYSITINVGVDEETGEPIRKKFTGASLNEAIYKSEQFKKDNPGGLRSKPNKSKLSPLTIEGITLEFMNSKNNSGVNCDNTFRTYSEVLKRIRNNSEDLIDKRIDKITRKEVEDFLNHQREKGYAQNTLKKDYQMLKQAFGIAKERKYISENFFEGYYKIQMPQSIVPEQKVTAFKLEDFKKLLEYLYSPDFKYAHRDEYLISFHCGLRIGEVLGLKKQDVDLENGLLHVKRTITGDKEGHTILGIRTKTPKATRDILLTELTIPVFEHAIKNMKPNPNDLLFSNDDGNVFTDSTLNDCLKRICKHVGIEDNAHNHKMRHTYSTNSYSSGIDYKVLEETMGHSDIKMTMDTYTDLPIEVQRKELQKYVDSVKMLLGDSINRYTKEEKINISLENTKE